MPCSCPWFVPTNQGFLFLVGWLFAPSGLRISTPRIRLHGTRTNDDHPNRHDLCLYAGFLENVRSMHDPSRRLHPMHSTYVVQDKLERISKPLLHDMRKPEA
jgi:hypothetical protein